MFSLLYMIRIAKIQSSEKLELKRLHEQGITKANDHNIKFKSSINDFQGNQRDCSFFLITSA